MISHLPLFHVGARKEEGGEVVGSSGKDYLNVNLVASDWKRRRIDWPPEVGQHDQSEDVNVVQSLPGGDSFAEIKWICCLTTWSSSLSSLNRQPEHPDEGLLWDLVDKIKGANSAHISLPVVINNVNVVVICDVYESNRPFVTVTTISSQFYNVVNALWWQQLNNRWIDGTCIGTNLFPLEIVNLNLRCLKWATSSEKYLNYWHRLIAKNIMS